MARPRHPPSAERRQRWWPRRWWGPAAPAPADRPPPRLSTPTIHQAVVGTLAGLGVDFTGDYLDVGSGSGDLIRLVRERFAVRTFACDRTERLMRLPGQRVERVDLNRQPLPYPEGRFGLVTCVETIEHLENFRAVLRETHRVLRPGGWLVVTTPNILNLRSRLRFFGFGFWNLFGPLAVGETEVQDTGGHINPVSYFYLAHALLETGFRELRPGVDHYQRSAVPALALCYLPIRLAARRAFRREVRKYQTIDERNRPLVRTVNSLALLLGRTLIVAARK